MLDAIWVLPTAMRIVSPGLQQKEKDQHTKRKEQKEFKHTKRKEKKELKKIQRKTEPIDCRSFYFFCFFSLFFSVQIPNKTLICVQFSQELVK
jgi:hypothetical protein